MKYVDLSHRAIYNIIDGLECLEAKHKATFNSSNDEEELRDLANTINYISRLKHDFIARRENYEKI